LVYFASLPAAQSGNNPILTPNAASVDGDVYIRVQSNYLPIQTTKLLRYSSAAIDGNQFQQ
jgi:hypothetical protein